MDSRHRANYIYHILLGNGLTTNVFGRVGALARSVSITQGKDTKFRRIEVDENGFLPVINGVSFRPNAENNIRFVVYEEKEDIYSVVVWAATTGWTIHKLAGFAVLRVDNITDSELPTVVDRLYDWLITNYEDGFISLEPEENNEPTRRPDPEEPTRILNAVEFLGWETLKEQF